MTKIEFIYMGQTLLTQYRQYWCPKFNFFDLFLWPTVIIQRATDGFYVDIMPTRVTRYNVFGQFWSICSTQPKLSQAWGGSFGKIVKFVGLFGWLKRDLRGWLVPAQRFQTNTITFLPTKNILEFGIQPCSTLKPSMYVLIC